MKDKLLSNRIRGQKAKRNGDFFENILMFFADRAGFNFIKIPNGCKTLGLNKLIRVKSPFDFILVRKDITIFCDAKHTEKDTFSYSDIDQNQVRNLLLVNTPNNLSGYIIDFNGEVFFAPVVLLKAIPPRFSLSKNFCLPMGTTKKIDFDFINGVSSNSKTIDFDSINGGAEPSTLATNKVKK